ncbi:RuvC-like resolvase [Gordonia phage Ligma]|nr:RuvC-like resolvase [Gordonia phage Ligma]UQT02107.1 RuvC-like resolvase [Gordonia phage Axumite]
MPRILALDLSLTDTGLCRVNVGPHGDLATREVTRIKSKAGEATFKAASERIYLIVAAIRAAILEEKPDLVVIESPALGSTTGQAHTRAWLWGKAYDEAASHAEVVTVTPQGIKMYATGRGNADKDEVLAAVVKRYPEFDVTNNNTADAVVAAAIGARFIGCPFDGDVPKTHLRAMDKLKR